MKAEEQKNAGMTQQKNGISYTVSKLSSVCMEFCVCIRFFFHFSSDFSCVNCSFYIKTLVTTWNAVGCSEKRASYTILFLCYRSIEIKKCETKSKQHTQKHRKSHFNIHCLLFGTFWISLFLTSLCVRK